MGRVDTKGVGRFSRVRLRGWNRDSIFWDRHQQRRRIGIGTATPSRSSFRGGGQASGLREAQLHGTSLQSSDPTKATGQSIPDTLPFGVI